MNYPDISEKLKEIIIQYFNLSPDLFGWEQPLECLHKDFKLLDHLVFLEKLIQEEFGKHISLVGQISTAIHSPKDIRALITSSTSPTPSLSILP